MFESLGFDSLTAPQAAVLFALALGGAFGLLAERSAFCFRRALFGPDRIQARAVWLMALAVAILGTQGAVTAGWIAFDDHRFLAGELPILAIAVGGALFGAGMVLARGCASRLTVLAGTGNLRALMAMLVFALVAHAALKGVLAPLRTSLGAITLPLEHAALPGQPLIWAALLSLAALVVALRARAGWKPLTLAAGIGALVPLGWVGTGFILYDDFDPIAMQSLSFTSSSADALFFTVASTAVPAGFGSGLIGGVVLGSLAAALLFRGFRWQSFHSPAQTGGSLLGGALMGLGGVLAGGCTVGAGLSGIPTLSLAALLAVAFIASGAWVAQRVLSASARGYGAPSTTPPAQPAE